MPTTAFVAGGDPDARIVRADQRPQTVLADGVTWEELAGPGHNLEPAVLRVPSGAGSGGAYSRPGEVFVHVLAGTLAFSVDGDDETRLRAGDSIILRPPSTWSWRNVGRKEALAVYVEQLSPEDWT
jgi:quercetin dioxygenase-like cupin family protein